MALSKFVLFMIVGGALFSLNCGGGVPDADPGTIDNGFESDDPTGSTSTNSTLADSGGSGADAAPSTNDSAGGSTDATRTVEEADIIEQDGNRLYALSRYGGLAVVDITDPDHMKVLGRKRTDGMPFEMYVRDGRAYVMLNDFGRYIQKEGDAYGQWVQSSEIVALDLANPSTISEVAHYDVPGTIADSRLVGDALYLVTYENGYCWNCNTLPSTVVTSFGVAAGANVTKVDQLVFSSPNQGYSAWQRSVSATNQRLYIAGPEWNWTYGQTNASSVVQVVDIQDPAGHMSKGADVPVAGQINSRWQMDEYNGVLRVVSQFGNGFWSTNGSMNPLVQTFTVASSDVITPLGQTEIVLPSPESLRSVRFDGTRGYAITAQQTDPLFTIDLSDPARPVQSGQVTMPGWILYMEPRGDRLVGFGYDNTAAWQANLAVSLFDVSDLAHPALLKSVSFGAGWGTFAEDQDRIQKSVSVLDDQGLVLVPFASYGRWDNNTCMPGQSGIQLIDYSRDTLTLRGLAPQVGLPRRAFLANSRLLAVSDRNVTSFDIGSRDAPQKTGEIDMSNPAYQMTEVGNQIASITNDWWTGEVMLSLTPKANADDADVSGKISLASLATPSADTCTGTGGWASWYSARIFANGNMVYVSVPIYTYSATSYGGKVVLGAVDVSDPQHPALVGKAEMPLTEHQRDDYYGYYFGSGFWDGYWFYSYYGGQYGALVGAGEGIVQLGSKIAYLEVDGEPIMTTAANGYASYTVKLHRKLHVADFVNPASPAVFPAIDLGNSLGVSPLHLVDGVVMTSRWIPSNNPGKVRFFADRVDISGASPVHLASINTPGSIVLVDPPSHRLVTADYTAKRANAYDWGSCQQALGSRAWFDYDTNGCVLINRSFKLSDLSGVNVSLRQTFEPPSQNIGGVRVADDRVYVTRYARYDYTYDSASGYSSRLVEDGGLWAIGGVREGKLSIVSQMNGDAIWPLAARGTKVAIYTNSGLAIYDTASPVPTLVTQQTLRGWGYTSDVLLGDDRAICSLGDWGLETIFY
ncbi:MAG: beta-propeller domain-containing protein [Polyangiaceae bacterium]|nr:beta-propeller domain-containing protein [Polyangiaceae bacterium]